jgi:hypothetical protein
MKSKLKYFIIYFPVILVALQVFGNLLFFISPDTYNSKGFYIDTFLGTNVFFSVFLLVFTFTFKFCGISKAAAIAECSFALFYLIFQRDDIYNILFQVIVGTLAILLTFYFISKKIIYQ